MHPPEPPLIRASELSQYSYCRRAWWLDVVKKWQPRRQDRTKRGERHHRRHYRRVQAGWLWGWTARLLWTGAAVMGAMAAWLGWLS